MAPQDERDRVKAYDEFRLEAATAEVEEKRKRLSDEILKRQAVEAKLAEAEAKVKAQDEAKAEASEGHEVKPFSLAAFKETLAGLEDQIAQAVYEAAKADVEGRKAKRK
jgi:phosphoglycerate-specific signal transduction histidine kinase